MRCSPFTQGDGTRRNDDELRPRRCGHDARARRPRVDDRHHTVVGECPRARDHVPLDPAALLEAARATLRELAHHAVALVEIRRAPGDEVERSSLGHDRFVAQIAASQLEAVARAVEANGARKEVSAQRLCLDAHDARLRVSPPDHHCDRADPGTEIERPPDLHPACFGAGVREPGAQQIVGRVAMPVAPLEDAPLPAQHVERLAVTGDERRIAAVPRRQWPLRRRPFLADARAACFLAHRSVASVAFIPTR